MSTHKISVDVSSDGGGGGGSKEDDMSTSTSTSTTTSTTGPINYSKWLKEQPRPKTKEEATALATEMDRMKAQDPTFSRAPMNTAFISTADDAGAGGLAPTELLGTTQYSIPVEKQNFALIQVSGPLNHIKAHNVNFRQLGYFATDRKRQEHIEDVLQAKYPDRFADRFLVKVNAGEPVLIGFDPVCDPQHPEHEATKKRIIAAQIPLKNEKRQNFKQYCDDRRTNREGLAQEEIAKAKARRKLDAEIEDEIETGNAQIAKERDEADGSKPPKITPDLAIRQQNFGTFSVCFDPENLKSKRVDKCVVTFFGAFQNDEIAFNYLNDSLQRKFNPLGIKCISWEMYEWFLCDLTRLLKTSSLNVRTTFGQQKHLNLYRGRNRNRAMVEDTKREQEALGNEPLKNPFSKTHPNVDVDAMPEIPEAEQIENAGSNDDPWTDKTIESKTTESKSTESKSTGETTEETTEKTAEDFFAFAHSTPAAKAYQSAHIGAEVSASDHYQSGQK